MEELIAKHIFLWAAGMNSECTQLYLRDTVTMVTDC